jgi:hypothetical protein
MIEGFGRPQNMWIQLRNRNTAFNQAYQTRDKTARGRREASARRARKLGQYSQKLHMLNKRSHFKTDNQELKK